MKRRILHSDLNSFYASVEAALNPSLKGKAVAVCGSEKDRCGIVLAKSEMAKAKGVKTAMSTFQARRLCPELIEVEPHYDIYVQYANYVRQLYMEYSDKVEPFGLDECWIDLSNMPCQSLETAEKIRKRIKKELDITVSIGISFNKVFAKLGSDMKKPDAITQISEENFKEKVWPLPAEDMIFVGRKTMEKLTRYCIHTIGDIAKSNREFLQNVFGKHGEMLWLYANGLDTAPVINIDSLPQIKSVGHGTTLSADTSDMEKVWRTILYLSQDIARRLRDANLSAKGVRIAIKDSSFITKQYQTKLDTSTQNAYEIALLAKQLLIVNNHNINNTRAVTVSTFLLEEHNENFQTDIFKGIEKKIKQNKLDATLDELHKRFGRDCLVNACLIKEKIGHDINIQLSDIKENNILFCG